MVNHKLKLKDIKKNDNYLDLAEELKTNVKHESDSYTNCNWCSSYTHKRVGSGTDGLGNKKMRCNNPNYSISVISSNT